MDVFELADVGAWEAWLEAHHEDDGEAWLRIAKLRSPLEVIRIGDALDGALCFGWIDGRRQGLDGDSFLQRYSPRRPRSPWSKVRSEQYLLFLPLLKAPTRRSSEQIVERLLAELGRAWRRRARSSQS